MLRAFAGLLVVVFIVVAAWVLLTRNETPMAAPASPDASAPAPAATEGKPSEAPAAPTPNAGAASPENKGAAAEGESAYEELTDREKQVLKLIAEGYTSKQIADALFLSVKTVMVHRANVMEKLNIHNRTDLIKYAIGKGLIKMPE